VDVKLKEVVLGTNGDVTVSQSYRLATITVSSRVHIICTKQASGKQRRDANKDKSVILERL